MNLFFFQNVFLSPEIDCFFGNRQQSHARAGQKKNTCFFGGNARPKSNVRAHLKQRKKNIVALSCWSQLLLLVNQITVVWMKCVSKHQDLQNSSAQIKQIFSHLKLWVAVAKHNFKLLKIIYKIIYQLL